ncbi:FGGY family carbohydrate kinase [Kribbella italica]|uniref:Sugar (Pentulose or hexulose) kinase n=1 Tax=Kribbella italica TaxID=1540520 RepID=A0A7W9JAT5_9ACTN|nr:sugar (pentulose or hexulose) kinase [Kribbella italica]
MAWIGVDLGTQSVRAVLVEATGEVLARAARPLTSRRGEVWHEQDPQEWITAVEQVLAEVASFGEVEGLAICSTSGTVLLTDLDGRPVSPALMYDDARAANFLPRIVAADPDRWGSAMQPTWALPKILWLDPAEDQLVAHSADVVAADLAGHPVATDTSHALKTGYDLVDVGERGSDAPGADGAAAPGGWPASAFERLGLPGHLLPQVVLPGTLIGTVSVAKAQVTGVPAGTPIVAGMTDGCAAQIAAGALTPGAWNSVLGTTLVLKGVTKDLITDPTGAVYSHRHPDGDGWLPGGASNTGAGALTTMLPGADLDALDRAATQLAGPVGATIYPLTKPGERFPFVAPEAAGFELGDVPDDLHRYVGVLQGVAFIERLAFEHLTKLGAEAPRSVALTGGAVRSEHWNQLRADVLGVPVELPEAADPAYGMAVLAASGGTSVAETARRMVRIGRVIEPRPSDRLTDLYGGFVAELDRRGYLR